MRESRQLSVSIVKSFDIAYDFLSEPTNFSKWASGLGRLRQAGLQWVTETPDGPMHVRFSERNSFGILDHWVTSGSGVEISIPLRVVANGSGCELIFTLFRQSDMTQEKFEADAAWVERDLAAAKKLLESQ